MNINDFQRDLSKIEHLLSIGRYPIIVEILRKYEWRGETKTKYLSIVSFLIAYENMPPHAHKFEKNRIETQLYEGIFDFITDLKSDYSEFLTTTTRRLSTELSISRMYQVEILRIDASVHDMNERPLFVFIDGGRVAELLNEQKCNITVSNSQITIGCLYSSYSEVVEYTYLEAQKAQYYSGNNEKKITLLHSQSKIEVGIKYRPMAFLSKNVYTVLISKKY